MKTTWMTQIESQPMTIRLGRSESKDIKGKKLFTSCKDNQIYEIDADKMIILSKINPSGSVYDMCLSNDANLLVTTTNGQYWKLWKKDYSEEKS